MKYEVAIQAVDYGDPKRVQVGDIVTMRPARGSVGRKELQSVIWVTINSPVDLGWADFKEPMRDKNGEVIAKRRFSIGVGLGKLKTIMPSFDLAKAANPNEVYQPFVNVDATGGRQRAKQDIPLTGLFTDKSVKTP